jgi:uracil-DNA glycosylase family 4
VSFLPNKDLSEIEKLYSEIIHCRACPRLVEFREKISSEKRAAYRQENYWGKPLTGFGDLAGELLIVGLAPAAHGGNRTGRVFTGDGSADFLMRSLHRFGFANQPLSVSRGDGLLISNAYIVAAVRCVPPDNKPLPSEILQCRPFLSRERAEMPNLKAVLALGKIGMDAYLNTFPDLKRAALEAGEKIVFGHAVQYQLKDERLFVSYHPSRQNTQTGRLTEEMFDLVIGNIRAYLDDGKVI